MFISNYEAKLHIHTKPTAILSIFENGRDRFTTQ
jgi:hypothetical protein